MLRTFRGGLLIGLAVAAAILAGAITYERYDTKTLKRTIRRRQGRRGRLRPRLLPPGRIRDFRRSEEGEVRAARRQRALQGIAEPHRRHPLPQLDLEHVARNQLRPLFPGSRLL